MSELWQRYWLSRRALARAGCWVLAILLVAVACSTGRQGASPPVPVTVARAEQTSVPFEITAPGTVEPMRAVTVTAQVSGIITAVHFREGDYVQEGSVLLEIDPRPYRNALRQAEAALTRDMIQLANARHQVDRYQSLAQTSGITAEQFESLQTAAHALEATLKSDSANLDNAQLNLEYTTVRAPISGRTGSLLIKEGNVVRAQGSTALVTVNQTDPILVRFAAPAPSLPLIQRFQDRRLEVRARAPTDSTDLTGTLVFVDNAVDTTTGTIMLKAEFDNSAGTFWPGEFVTATLVLYEERGVVVVPIPAVVDAEAGNYVYVVGEDDRVAMQPVVVGRSVGDDVIVTEGLTGGETVVTDGQLRLVPGAQVQIRNIQTSPGGDA
jgi:multidrug efflux system membrane fusion protein